MYAGERSEVEDAVLLSSKFDRAWERVVAKMPWLYRGKIGKYKEMVRDEFMKEFSDGTDV